MNIAIIPAAGSGSRLGGEVPKQFIEIAGAPILIHTIRRFVECSEIDLMHFDLSVNREQIYFTLDNGNNSEKQELSEIRVLGSSLPQAEGVKPHRAVHNNKSVATMDAVSQANKSMQGDAPACNVCGHITVRSGTCYKCLNCGNSLGCS